MTIIEAVKLQGAEAVRKMIIEGEKSEELKTDLFPPLTNIKYVGGSN